METPKPGLAAGDGLIWALGVDELRTCGEGQSETPFLTFESDRPKNSGLLGATLGVKDDNASMLPRKAEAVRVRFDTLPSGAHATSTARGRKGPPQSALGVVGLATGIEATGAGRLGGNCVAVRGGEAGKGCVTLLSTVPWPNVP